VKIKRVRSDNGTEFKNTNIEEYLDGEGIGHELSVPYTPQQNGIVERKNRTLIEAVRTMLDEYKTSDIFWQKQSTRLVMLSTDCISTSFVTKPPMNF
jgi:transposase InsO family protein